MAIGGLPPRGRQQEELPSLVSVWGRFLVIIAAYFPFCGGTLQLLDLLAPEADIDMMSTSSAVSAVAVSGLLIWLSCRSMGREGWARIDPRFAPQDLPEPLRFGVAELSVLPLMLGPALLAVLAGGGRWVESPVTFLPAVVAVIVPVLTATYRWPGLTVACAGGVLAAMGSAFVVPSPWPEATTAVVGVAGLTVMVVRRWCPVPSSPGSATRDCPLDVGVGPARVQDDDRAVVDDLIRARRFLRASSRVGLLGLVLWGVALIAVSEADYDLEQWVRHRADLVLLLLSGGVALSLIAMGVLRLARPEGDVAARLVPPHGPVADRAALDAARRETGRPARPRRITTVVMVSGLIAVTAGMLAVWTPHPSERSPLVSAASGRESYELRYLVPTPWASRVSAYREETGTSTDRRFVDDTDVESPPPVVRDAWSVVVRSKRDPSRPDVLGVTAHIDVFAVETLPAAAAAGNLLNREREFVPDTVLVDVAGAPPRWKAHLEQSQFRKAVAVGHAAGHVMRVTLRPPYSGEPPATDEEMARRLLELVSVIEQRGIAGFADDTEP